MHGASSYSNTKAFPLNKAERSQLPVPNSASKSSTPARHPAAGADAAHPAPLCLSGNPAPTRAALIPHTVGVCKAGVCKAGACKAGVCTQRGLGAAAFGGLTDGGWSRRRVVALLPGKEQPGC